MTLPKKARYQMFDGLEEKQDAAKEMQSMILRRLGWRYTSETPGSVWLWTKQIVIHRRYRQPALINRGEGLGWVKNPDADGWIEKAVTYDALCDTNTALRIEESMIAEAQS